MCSPQLAIYTEQYALRHMNGIVQLKTTAMPIIKGKKVISAGDLTERINFLDPEDKQYNLAIQTITKKEQDRVHRQHYAGVCFFDLTWLFWKPLTIKIASRHSIIVLVNINSAIKRLGLLGFSAKEIITMLDRGVLIKNCRRVFQIKKEREIGDQIRKALEHSSVPQELHPAGQKLFLNWVQKKEITREEIHLLMMLSKEVKIIDQESLLKLKEYICFNRALRTFEIKNSHYLLNFFEEIYEDKLKQGVRYSFNTAIGNFLNKINRKADDLNSSFEEALLIYHHKKNFNLGVKEARRRILILQNQQWNDLEILRISTLIGKNEFKWQQQLKQTGNPVIEDVTDGTGRKIGKIYYHLNGAIEFIRIQE